jgi:ABC-type multidrug transport system fused ATPase/permease subunit
VILLYAIPQVNLGGMSGVSLAVVSLLTMASFEATNSLPQAAQNLTASLASAKKLFDLVNHRMTTTNESLPDLSAEVVKYSSQLEVQNLTFAYPESGEAILKNVNLEIERGKIVALVGPSGAGKTSLVNLLLRFWEPQSGMIEVRIYANSLRKVPAGCLA